MLFKKIISAGSPGAESAALDVALKLDIPCGGLDAWGLLINGKNCLKRYRLIEGTFKNTQSNIHESLNQSDGMIVFSYGPLRDYLDYLCMYALTHNKPFLHIDHKETTEEKASLRINLWAAENLPDSVHVAGTTLEEDPRIYQTVYDTLYRTLTLGCDAASMPHEVFSIKPPLPKTVDQAVQILIDEIAIKDRVRIANMTLTQVSMLNIGLGRYIRNRFGLWAGNKALMISCAREEGLEAIHEDQASAIIIKKFAAALSESHKIRVVNG